MLLYLPRIMQYIAAVDFKWIPCYDRMDKFQCSIRKFKSGNLLIQNSIRMRLSSTNTGKIGNDHLNTAPLKMHLVIILAARNCAWHDFELSVRESVVNHQCHRLHRIKANNWAVFDFVWNDFTYIVRAWNPSRLVDRYRKIHWMCNHQPRA